MPALTAASVQKYTANAKRREIPDARATGLYLVIQPKPSGQKSWALRFRRPDGRPAKMTLGRVDLTDRETKDDPVVGAPMTLGQARELAAQIDRKRQRGIDVIEEHKAAEARKSATAVDRAANTFGTCVREFFAAYKTKRQTCPRRWRDNAGMFGLRYKPGADPATAEPEVIKGGLADIWNNKPMAEIDGHDVHAVVSEARKHGSEGRARKMHAALSILFSWLLRERRVTANPCSGVWRPGPPPARERVLSDAEIASFWRGCKSIGTPFGQLFQFMLLTGCRLREAANMTRGELTADGVWTIPGSRTKNSRPISLALPPMALQLIRNLPVIESATGYVFTTNGRTPVSGFSVAKRQLDAAIAKSAGRAVPEFRLHDLRRTFASGMAALGVALPVVEKLLNHVSGSFGGIVGVYQKHEYHTEKTEALARWATHVEGLVEGISSKVVQLRKKKGA
jgi:integrase